MNFLVKLWLHLDVDKTLANHIGRSYNMDVVFDASKKNEIHPSIDSLKSHGR